MLPQSNAEALNPGGGASGYVADDQDSILSAGHGLGGGSVGAACLGRRYGEGRVTSKWGNAIMVNQANVFHQIAV